MAKTRRGRALWRTPARSRGICPVCLTTRTKLLYTKNKSDGTQITVCKRCINASESRINKAISIQGLAFRRSHVKEFHKIASNLNS